MFKAMDVTWEWNLISAKKWFNILKPGTQCLALLPTTSASEETLSLEPDVLSPTTDGMMAPLYIQHGCCNDCL